MERAAVMPEAVVSASWHRVADLRPSLVPGLRIVRQQVRDQVWQLLVEPASGRQLRLNPGAYDLVGRFDGRETVDALWHRVLQLRRDEAPTQDEVLQLLAQLFRDGVVQFDAAPHLSLMFARRTEETTQRRRGALMNPLMMRTRLGDPGPLLMRWTPLAHALFSPGMFVAWVLLVGWALLAAGSGFGELKAHAIQVLTAPRSFLMAWVCFPAIKVLHELGHGLAVRRFGGEVREFGVSLMLLVPAPYVDASAANAFAAPGQRAIVSAAGIMVELAIAAAALGVWVMVSPGQVRDAAMVTMLIGSISTLVFNANPLMRLDGYHILCDALQLPNLASRSQAWWLRQWLRLCGRQAPTAVTAVAGGELKWLVGYAPLSWAYRVVLLAGLAAWVGSHSWVLGWATALFALAWLGRRAWLWLAAAGPRAQRAGAIGAAALVLLLAVVPAPQSVAVRGVVWPPAPAQLRAHSAGFVEEVLAADGSIIAAGEPLLRLSDPILAAQHERLAAQQVGLRAQQYAALLAEPAAFVRLEAELQRAQAELERVEEQQAGLILRSALDGRVAWSRPRDLPGGYAKRGALLGHVVVPGMAQVRMALPQEEFLRVRGRVKEVEVLLADAPFEVHRAHLLDTIPGATQDLPSAALGDRQGGPIPVDPTDKDGLRSRGTVFLLDAVLDEAEVRRMGGRATVKLALPAEPVAWQFARRLRQLLVRQFSPTGQL